MASKEKKPQKVNTTTSASKSIRLLPPRQSSGAAASEKERTQVNVEPRQQFPIVGIGASAGGLAAFEAFFSGMPAVTDPNMAFVLVQHLAPDHKSILTGLIQRYTRMEVSEVEDGMEVRPNCAYIIPPGKDMAFVNGSLQLLEPSAPRGQRLPIDFFFRSLARDQRERAICIVLSGTGSDGTLGVRAIKGEGGMAMAQSPNTTEYGGMPKSAIATGLIDYKLPPAKMAVQLMAYAARGFAELVQNSSLTPKEDESTRRATNFFRDPESFKALEKKIIPKLFADRSAGDTVRIWSQGCSTGEEAYSLAILLQEHLNTLKRRYPVQIFSTTMAEHFPQPLLTLKQARLGKLSLRELTEQALLQQIAPTGALVNGRGDILYLHGRTGMYLKPPPGETAVNNILEMACDGLQHELAAALHKTSTSQKISHRTGLRVKSHKAFITVNLTISPMITGPTMSTEVPLYLVILEEVVPLDGDTSIDTDGSTPAAELDASVCNASLRQQLRAKEQFLQTANEELKCTIEEMQSINEDLQSTNEELATSKEALQSTNEELSTVNAELLINVEDLTRSNDDMNNMVAGTGIGTVFVDHQLCILRFTPDTTRIINLIKTDVGRPIGHIVCNFKGYDDLVGDVQAVLDNLTPKENDVQTVDGLWYTMRMRPYCTINERIEGAVISFIDITERKRIEDALQKAFDEIRTLRGIVPICAKCKQIRDDHGFWSQVEDYVQNHTEAEFSHGICPECAKELYPDYDLGPGSTDNPS